MGRGEFSVDQGGIRYGMSAIRSVGDTVVDEILRERELNGPFKDLTDFIGRLSNKEANKRTIESFIFAGAFDSFGLNRRQMNLMYPEIVDQVNAEKKRSMSGQMSLMEFLGEEEKEKTRITFPNMPEFPKEEILEKEKEVLGIYVSGHPLDAYKDLVDKYADAST
ncbi:MAG: DNA polymerase III subunit alpha, partial [Oscillospiraceae bacterium]|nr:DNA polymerase III subunit alpha [Oscillospiraceae bacterium]